MISNDYYAGGCKVLVGGVPCRLARKPGTYGKTALRQTGRALTKPMLREVRSNGTLALRSIVTGKTEAEAYREAIAAMRVPALPLSHPSTMPAQVTKSAPTTKATPIKRKAPRKVAKRKAAPPASPFRRALAWVVQAFIDGALKTAS